MQVSVAFSSLADGSMHNRNDPLDAKVIANREAWLTSQGIALDDTSRVLILYEGDDYCRYKEVGEAERGINMRGNDRYIADALITTTPGHALMLPVADCIATILFDPSRGVLMLSHLGRHSLEQQGAIRSVEYLVEHYGSKPQNIQVWLSPSISKKEYPIRKLDGLGMKEACHQQLKAAGIHDNHINDDTRDTGTDDALYSYSEFLKGSKPYDGCYASVAVMRR